jgi:hypothetical protein
MMWKVGFSIQWRHPFPDAAKRGVLSIVPDLASVVSSGAGVFV